MNVSFHVMENHSPSVTYTVKVYDADDVDALPDLSNISQLTPVQTPFSNISVGQLTAGTLLPFEKDFSFTYDGKGQANSVLSNGDYVMDMRLADGDSPPNETPDAVNTVVNTETIIDFTVETDTTPPTITLTSPEVDDYLNDRTLTLVGDVDDDQSAVDSSNSNSRPTSGSPSFCMLLSPIRSLLRTAVVKPDRPIKPIGVSSKY
jgi:hypothetical protein